MTRFVVLAVLAVASPASAEEFEPLDQLGQIGLGGSMTGGEATRFDSTLRLGHSRHATSRLWAGGFGELHTLGFDTWDFSIGPQAQLRLTDLVAVQVRTGLGAGTEGTHALVGAQLGTWLAGANVTARREFGSGEVAVTVNVELAALLPLFPVVALLSPSAGP